MVRGPSVLSQGEEIVHFAVPGCLEDAHLQVKWPSGETTEETLPAPQRSAPPSIISEES